MSATFVRFDKTQTTEARGDIKKRYDGGVVVPVVEWRCCSNTIGPFDDDERGATSNDATTTTTTTTTPRVSSSAATESAAGKRFLRRDAASVLPTTVPSAF